MQPLIGIQLPLLPGVRPYLLSNPADCYPTQPTCPVGLSCETTEDNPLSPEHQGDGLYTSPVVLSLVVREHPPDYNRPLSPEQAFTIGDRVKILAVQAHQARGWIGKEGTVHKLSHTRVWVKLQGRSGFKAVELPLPVDCLEKLPIQRRQQRRYSPKGTASGWLEDRQGNRKRKTPSISYYYGWLEGGTCRKRYVPVGRVYRVQEMITQRRPVAEILAFLGVKQEAPVDQG